MENYPDLLPHEQLAYRKKREIWRKLGALNDEFDLWLTRSNPGGLYEKHHTQIRAVKAHLGQWSKAVRSIVKSNLREDADVFLESILNAERLILSEHRIWEYFRSKFNQREEEGFRSYLRVSDEFAWYCYRPVQQYVYPDPLHASRKEPPLVFFNGGMSPFSASRGKDFKPEAVSGDVLRNKEIEAITKLPIPVVGVPWHQIRHLPEAVVIGHEVGHLIEDDFGLTGQLKVLLLEALAEANGEERQAAWCKWLGEIFADIYGCLSTGPAFVGALMDFLARDYGEISVEKKTEDDWGLYPTIYLRGHILFKTLEQMGFDKEAERYRKLWSKFSSKMPDEYTADISFIVPKLLNGKLIESSAPGSVAKSVMEVFCFTKEQQEEVSLTLKQLEMGMTPTSEDICVLIASVRAAYEADPKKFIRKDYGAMILVRIERDLIQPGIRSKEVPLSDDLIAEKIKEYEKSAGEIICNFLQEDKEDR